MIQKNSHQKLEDLEFEVRFSGRRTIGLSVLPDSSVVMRVPYRTSQRTIERVVRDKYGWLVKHRDNYRKLKTLNKVSSSSFTEGEIHLFRGRELVLTSQNSARAFVRFNNEEILIGSPASPEPVAIKKQLNAAYKKEALNLFPLMLSRILDDHKDQNFKPSGLIIRKMKRRWGSCSIKGIITLNTELIKLSDVYIEYVILHELCHLKHHNHGSKFYDVLSEVFPDWKKVRKALRQYIQ